MAATTTPAAGPTLGTAVSFTRQAIATLRDRRTAAKPPATEAIDRAIATVKGIQAKLARLALERRDVDALGRFPSDELAFIGLTPRERTAAGALVAGGQIAKARGSAPERMGGAS